MKDSPGGRELAFTDIGPYAVACCASLILKAIPRGGYVLPPAPANASEPNRYRRVVPHHSDCSRRRLRRSPSIRMHVLAAVWLFSTSQVGTFRLGEVVFAQQSLLVGPSPSAVAAADLDQDGHLDLVVANDGSYVTVFRGDGRGGMASRGRVAAGEHPADLALADLDGNGAIDIAVTNHETNYLTILRGDGQGAFRAASNSPPEVLVLLGASDSVRTAHLTGGESPWGLAAADLNEDGKDDLVIVDSANPRATVYLSSGR